MGRTCGEPDEIKKNTHPKYFTALFREQGPALLKSLSDNSDKVGTARQPNAGSPDYSFLAVDSAPAIYNGVQ